MASSSESAPGLAPQALKRLMKELERLRKDAGSGADRVEGAPVKEDDLSVWSVKCMGLDDDNASASCKAVGAVLKDKGHAPEVDFRFHFPRDYPTEPPFVYVHTPRIRGGHIHGGGAMCLDVLMPDGWTPATTVASLMRTIRSDIDSMFLEASAFDKNGALVANDIQQAKSQFSWISNVHTNWQTTQPQWSQHRDAEGAPIDANARKRQRR